MEENEVKKARFQMLLPEDLKDWCQKEASQMGVSMAAYVTFMLYQAKQQKEVTSTLGAMMNKLEEIERKIEE